MAPAGGKLLDVWPASGVGKTHLACAVARAVVELGGRAKFFAATTLVQTLQQAKRQLLLPNTLKKTRPL